MTTAQPEMPRYLEYLPLDDLLARMDPRNPKDHADADIRKSMGRFGYTEPVFLDERTGRLVAGHGRLENLDKARQKGKSAPDGILDDADRGWLVPTNRGWSSRSDEEAGAYLVAANQLTIKGGWKPDPLATILSELRALPDGLEGLAMTPSEVTDILAAYGPVPDLDDLGGQVGDPEPEDFWPVLRFRVSPDTKAAFERWVEATEQIAATDDEVITGLLELAVSGASG